MCLTNYKGDNAMNTCIYIIHMTYLLFSLDKTCITPFKFYAWRSYFA